MQTSLQDVPVLVTGGTGFIGSHLVRRLVQEEAQVFLLSPDEDFKNIVDIQDKITIHKGDLNSLEQLQVLVSKIQPIKIFHLGAYVNQERELDIAHRCFTINVLGTLNLLLALKNVPYDCFVNTGTCDEYGTNDVPFTEDQLPNPVSPYSASKVASTYLCNMMVTSFDAPIVTVRPFLTYGPGQRTANLIPSLIINALSNKPFSMTKGEQAREFNYVGDIVDGYIKASITPQALGQTINLGSGEEHYIKDVVRMICDIVNPLLPIDYSLPYRPGETMHFYSDNSKAQSLLGWKPTTPLREGLQHTIDWYTKKYKDGIYTQWMKKP
jgi:UDP-glucose 4-epimerase